jgi:hypothetical protein
MNPNPDPAVYLDPDQRSAIKKVEMCTYLRLFFQVTDYNTKSHRRRYGRTKYF